MLITAVMDAGAGLDHDPDAGFGTLMTNTGNLPLFALDVRARITGMVATVFVAEEFRNRLRVPLEATYIFPLPERAAVTAMSLQLGDRVIDSRLVERGHAHNEYEAALADGMRAAIVEQERADVFTMRVGNIAPGERVVVRLTLSTPLQYAAGQLTFRFPLVVAPRYIPGVQLDGPPVGAGGHTDTEAVPDASRITPPVLLTGFPNPVRLTIEAIIDTHVVPIHQIGCNLPAELVDGADIGIEGTVRVRVNPGSRLDRDFVLRVDTGQRPHHFASIVTVTDPVGRRGTFNLTVLPSTTAATAPRPLDLVVLLDRSASMDGWQIVAARRAAARIIDSLTPVDRFAVLTFNDTVSRPVRHDDGLVDATDRNRFDAVEHLVATYGSGNPVILPPLEQAARLLRGSGREPTILVITAGLVGNEDQIIEKLAPLVGGIRIDTVGVGVAVNAGFLQRLADLGRGRFEVAESEDRLDEAIEQVQRQLAAPLVTDLELVDGGLGIARGTVTPARLPDVYPGVALLIAGRWVGNPVGEIAIRGISRDGQRWISRLVPRSVDDRTVATAWARAHLADLEDRYLTCPLEQAEPLERTITRLSLSFGVLSRFTAFVAVDKNPIGDRRAPHRVVQAVELPPGSTHRPAEAPSDYQIEYGRRMAAVSSAARSAGSGPRPVTPMVVTEPPARAAPMDDPTLTGARPTNVVEPHAEPVGRIPLPDYGTPMMAPPPQAAPPPPPGSYQQPADRPSKRGPRIAAAGAAAAVAGALAIGGAVVLGNNGPVDSTAKPADTAGATATTSESRVGEPSSAPKTTTDAKTGVSIAVTLTETPAGTKVVAEISGIAAGQSVRMVVVTRDGARTIADSWRVTTTDKERRTTTLADVAKSDITDIIIEDNSGNQLVSVHP
ncbi:VIT domain-containing protein [Antrihabitans stalactiti]|uniref:VIT domain-containing protein n=1 Tax=Antrihabitans stalactiti TaxID=2584121 RepID=UPI00146D5529